MFCLYHTQYAYGAIQHYNHIANQNRAENQRAYREWILSMTPDNIRKANVARNNLKRLGIKGYRVHLVDDRQVTRPRSAHVEFLKERFSTGDMKGIAAAHALKQIMKEWRELGETDKQVSPNNFVRNLLRLCTSSDLGKYAEILQLTGSVQSSIYRRCEKCVPPRY